jgi:peptidoglycan/LPS O-acetylase OafA/YrhL
MRELVDRPKGQMPALDALRSFAILIVVWHHWSILEYARAGGVPTAIQNTPLFYYGWTGVDLFFVLSGYLIGRQLWRELDRTGSIRFPRFILRRGLRIWPIYFAVLVWYALTSPIIHPRLSDWLFLSNYLPASFTRGWSLSTEEQFYIALPLLLLLVRRRIPLFGYLGVLLGIEALVLVNRHFAIDRILAAGGIYERSDYTLIYPFHLHLEGLLAGVVIALLSLTRPQLFRPPTARHGISWLGLGVMVVSTATALILHVIDDKLFSFLVLGLIYGGGTFFALLDRSILSRWLHWRGWYPISRLSYSMYLNHWWLLPRTNPMMVRGVQSVTGDPTTVFLTTMLLGTALSFLLAVVMFLLVEHPFLVLRDRVLTSTRRPAVGLPVPAGATPGD